MSKIGYGLKKRVDYQCGDENLDHAFTEMQNLVQEAFNRAKSICWQYNEQLTKVCQTLFDV